MQEVVEAMREPAADMFPSAANSFEADALRAEIIAVGRKLWQRQYVDGNGGNISVRLGPRFVLCTPTMMSKGDLEPADICLSDLDGNILAGDGATILLLDDPGGSLGQVLGKPAVEGVGRLDNVVVDAHQCRSVGRAQV